MSVDLERLKAVRAQITARTGVAAEPLDAPPAPPKEPFKGASKVASGVGLVGLAGMGYYAIVRGSLVGAGIIGGGTWLATRYLKGAPLIPEL